METETPRNILDIIEEHGQPKRGRLKKMAAAALATLLVAVALIIPTMTSTAEAAPAADQLEVRALSNGKFAITYFPTFTSNGGQVSNYEIVDGNGMQVVGRYDAQVLPGFPDAQHTMQTKRTYTDGRQVCFQIRAYMGATSTTNAWSEKTCAWAATYAEPEGLTATPISHLAGGAVLTWGTPDFIPLGSVLVSPEWIQIYDGNSYRWLKLGNGAPFRITHSDYNSEGRYTCYTTRYWVSGVGVSSWSNWACATLS